MPDSSRLTAPRRSFRQRKQQTRLQFSSLPSSSPGKQDYSRAVQDRPAGVTSQGAKNSARAADELSPDPISLLSPKPSSHVQAEIKEPPQMSPHISFPSSPTRKRVTGIQLSDDSDSDSDGLITPAQKRRKLSSSLDLASTPDSLPRRRSRRLHQGSSSSPLTRLPSASEDEIDELQSSPPRRRRSSRLGQISSPHPASSTIHESPPTSPLPEVTSLISEHSKLSDLGSPETSDDDVVMVTKPAPRRKSRLDVDDPYIMDNGESQYGSDSGHKRRTPYRRKSERDDFVVDDDEIEYISSEDESTYNQRSIKEKPRRAGNLVVSDDDDEVEPVSFEADADDDIIMHSPTKSRRQPSGHKALGKRRARTQQDQDELDDDLQDLQSSDQETPRTKARRTRGGPVTTKMDKTREHLQLLKRRRAGETIARAIDSDEEEDEEQVGADLDLIGQPHYALSDGGSISSDTDQSAVDENVEQEETRDDFIEDDTENRLNQPHSDLPIEFTAFATKKPKELFIHIVEWMVKNKIAPAFSRQDPVYNLAFARVDDQVKAQAGSRLISSAWGNEFKNAILARPSMTIKALPGEDDKHIRSCDACNRTNNPARYEFVFSGEPYYKKTLEPVDNSDDDEEDEDETDQNSVSYDEAGHVIASSQTFFYLGRFCAANAQMGHKLTHWKYSLNESLMTYLESQGVLSAEAIVAREKMVKKKREKEAESIVDQMEETGKIDELWGEFQNDLNDARIGMQDFEKRGGRTKGRVGAIQVKTRAFVTQWDKDRVRKTVALGSDSEGE